MKCFFCQKDINLTDKECSGCARILKKYCEKCGLVFSDAANFCMACGGKLADFIPKEVVPDIEIVDNHAESSPEIEKNDIPEAIVLEEHTEKTNNQEHETYEDYIEIIEIIESEIAKKEETKPRKDYLTLEIEAEEPEKENFSDEKETETLTADIDSENHEHDGIILHSEIEDSSEFSKIELTAKEILVKSSSKKLSPIKIESAYPIKYDAILNFIKKSQFPNLAELFSLAGESLKKGEGAAFFAEGEEGVGKSWFIENFSNFVKTTKIQGAEIVFTTANYLAFDYMIVIDFIKQLLEIKTDDLSEVKEKVEKHLGDFLPKFKKECLIALLCFNFLPVKDKLPKNDLEYLFSYVIYMLTKRKPVFWLIDNAWAINLRTIKFLRKLKDIIKNFPLAIILFTEPENTVFEFSSETEKIKFKIPKQEDENILKLIEENLQTNRIPTDIEKLIKQSNGNILFALETIRYLKDLNLIFLMKESWRFGKISDDFSIGETIEELIMARFEHLSDDEKHVLKRVVLLNITEIPENLILAVFNDKQREIIEQLIIKEYLVREDNFLKFTSSALPNILRRNIKIGEEEKSFYKNCVIRLSSSDINILPLNKNWLLLSYINLGGVVDKRFNSFLFSSAIYLEKLGFFEMAQRSYQTILSSFNKDDSYDDFKILLEIKNSRLWRFVDPQWGLIFWKKLKEVAEERDLIQLKLLSEAEIILSENSKINSEELVEIISQLHNIGCYENELFLLERFIDILINSENYFDANTFALRSYKIIKDIYNDKRLGKISKDDIVLTMFIKICLKLGEVNILLANFDYALEALNEALENATQAGFTYFKAKAMYLIAKIHYLLKESWEDYLHESFSITLGEMQFEVLKSFFIFFEDEKLENKSWISPYLEYKNWLSIL